MAGGVRQRVMTLLLPLLLLGQTVGFPITAAATSEAEQHKERLKQLRQRISDLQDQLNLDRSRYDDLTKALRQVERRIGRIGRAIKRLKRQEAEQEQNLASLQRRQKGLQHSVTEQQRYLAGQIRAAYAMGRQEQIKILLNQEDPAALGRTLTYYDYLNRARSERIENLNRTIAELQQVESEIAQERERLQQLRSKEEQERDAMEVSRNERKGVVGRLKIEIRSKDEQLNGLLADEKELKRLLQALTEALSDIPVAPGDHKPFARLKGQLSWPTAGKRIKAYGEPRRVGSLRWQGVVIAGREGQEVKAVSHGRVAYADWLRGYGLLLIIDHGDGYMTLYGHNQSLLREVGDWVERGDVIAAVGNSGGLDTNALYFEVRKDGKPTDPVRWCRR
ncbi:MAG: peptidoglycan DD-metalloendopeptidase family protein [Chromatiales bacterium]|nr:peptidoglycan DD-metalloendopeptidase family protein [Chromatiales bacterium]